MVEDDGRVGRNKVVYRLHFLVVIMMVVEVDHVLRGGNSQLHTEGVTVPYGVWMVRHPRRQSKPKLFLGVATRGNEENHLRLKSICRTN